MRAVTVIGLLALFAGLVVLTWARWGNVRVDAGGAVDRAAMIADGAVLYRDVLSPYGPVAPYVLACLFRIFGTHLNVVYATGVVLLLSQSWLLWRIARRFLPECECAVGMAAFWVLFGFHPSLFGWVLPNTFACTFGAFFATAVLALLVSDLSCPRSGKLVAASLCTAFAGLSKIEFGATAFATMVVHVLASGGRGPGLLRMIWLMMVPGLALATVTGFLLLTMVPWKELVFDNVYRIRSFERSVPAYYTGLFPPLMPMLAHAGVRYGLEYPLRALAVAVGLKLVDGNGWRRVSGVLLALLGIFTPMLPGYPPNPDLAEWRHPQLQFAWTPVAWLIVGAAALVSSRRNPDDRMPSVLLLVAMFSVLMTLRWNFRLAWPSYYAVFAPFLAIFLVRLVVLGTARASPSVPVALVMATAVVSGAVNNWTHLYGYSLKTFELDYPRGRIITTPAEGAPMKATIDYVREHTASDEYVAVIPEERFINFLAERKHPTRDVGIGPGWLANAHDVARFIAELEEKGTRMVVVRKTLYPQFQTGSLARYNPEVVEHINSHYDEVRTIGEYVIYERPAR